MRQGKMAMPVFDYQQLVENLGGDLDLFREIAAMFLEDSSRLLAKLSDAVTNRQVDQVHLLAHSLKGSVANFGATAAYEAARQLEQAAKQGKVELFDQHFIQLVQALGQLQDCLRRALEEN